MSGRSPRPCEAAGEPRTPPVYRPRAASCPASQCKAWLSMTGWISPLLRCFGDTEQRLGLTSVVRDTTPVMGCRSWGFAHVRYRGKLCLLALSGTAAPPDNAQKHVI
ncbi:hypothetical protein AAFF_G00131630 [Aldrovandia affinis]|uniref:Uncharacterized protein n=1 Tax=Aldrovandia affinis TaxID=143900 RepID=A0AAD7RQK8_9TELE|nr:hypothetical protein AAFF_G00131630 [Aldrovandia affinis]